MATGSQWWGGNTRAPWNIGISASGSSAGPGAATSAGLVGFSIGSEVRSYALEAEQVNPVPRITPHCSPSTL